MSVNDLRKCNNQYNEQELPGPDVQQLPGGGGADPYSLGVCPACFAWIILSYLVPYHLIYILFLGPCILCYAFWGSTPPAPHGDV